MWTRTVRPADIVSARPCVPATIVAWFPRCPESAWWEAGIVADSTQTARLGSSASRGVACPQRSHLPAGTRQPAARMSCAWNHSPARAGTRARNRPCQERAHCSPRIAARTPPIASSNRYACAPILWFRESAWMLRRKGAALWTRTARLQASASGSRCARAERIAASSIRVAARPAVRQMPRAWKVSDASRGTVRIRF